MKLRKIAQLLENETWQEGDHPRDGDGKFATGSGGPWAKKTGWRPKLDTAVMYPGEDGKMRKGKIHSYYSKNEVVVSDSAGTHNTTVSLDKVKPVESAKPAKPKAKTYDVAKKDIIDHMTKSGWKPSKPGLKIPHITSPDGKVRLWFKSQAVYSSGGNNINDFGSARTLSYDLDIRKVDPEKFSKWAYEREMSK